MNSEQKLNFISQLKEKGNVLYQNKKYEEAIEKYELALTYIDQLQLRFGEYLTFIFVITIILINKIVFNKIQIFRKGKNPGILNGII